jgi:predicted enzyme related to lactoylglutathione lyase
MKELITFFEIPATDFHRAVLFYETILEMKLEKCDCGEEKMAFFPAPVNGPRGAISLAKGFEPSVSGVLIHFGVEDIEAVLRRTTASGGTIHFPKTKIEAEGEGHFALIIDSEGNKVGLHEPG